MKKFFIPICAIVLAFGFSAFSPTHKSGSKGQNDYFWYELNSAKTHTTGDALNPGSPLTEIDMIAEYQVCPDVEQQPVCLAGFEQEQQSPASVTGLPEEQLIREDN